MNNLTDIMDRHKKEIVDLIDGVRKESYEQGKKDAIEEYKQTDEYIKECVQRYLKGKADGKAEAIEKFAKWEDDNCINYSEFDNHENVVKRYLEEAK